MERGRCVLLGRIKLSDGTDHQIPENQRDEISEISYFDQPPHFTDGETEAQ